MRFKLIFLILFLTLVKTSSAVQCNTNPCEFDATFRPPTYGCYDLSPNDYLCTCPNGKFKINAKCRLCDPSPCGSNAICIEDPAVQSPLPLCLCFNGTSFYTSPGSCPTMNSTMTTTTVTIAPTSATPTCLNGGYYDTTAKQCICRTGFNGTNCEISIGQQLCQRIICDNLGVCNPVPLANHEIDVQCWCTLGYFGNNCELKGIQGRCTSTLCQNNGLCQERVLGNTLYAYCECTPGYTGEYCQTRYFACTQTGRFTDLINCKHGRYFECAVTTLTGQSCPKGWRFNATTNQCDLNATCPP